MKFPLARRFSYRWLTEKPLHVPIDKTHIILFYLIVNYLIVFLDVTIAHALNRFIPIYEWVPVIYLPIVTISTLLLLFNPKPGWNKNLNILLSLLGIVIGVIGLGFHLQGASAGNVVTFAGLTSGNPVFAPLAFIALGSIGAITALDDRPGIRKFSFTQKTRWLLMSTAFWFFATALVAIFDHARTGFANLYTWVPFYIGVFAAIITLLQAYSDPDTGLSRLFTLTMILSVIVGLMGFAFHLSVDLAGRGSIAWFRIFYLAPGLAPLLFCDLGVWGALVFLDPLNEEEQALQSAPVRL